LAGRAFFVTILVKLTSITMKRLKKIALKAKKNSRYFERLYRESFNMAWKYFATRIKNKADIEDVMQDFYLKLFRSLENYDGSGNFYAFFYKLAHSTYLDWQRKLKPESNRSEPDFHQIPARDDPIQKIEKQFDLDKAMQSLEEIDREILMLYFVDGLKNKEIAQILGLTEENVKVRKHRALKKLKSLLNDHGQA